MLQSLLVLHAEAVLLIHDDHAKVLEPNVGAQEPVRAYHDVDSAVGKGFNYGLLLLWGLEAAERADDNGKIRKAVAECSRMLLGENGRRDENRHLPAGLNRLERRPNRNLRLAVSHVADQQPVHRPRTLHIGFHISCRSALVGSVFEK